MDALWAQVQQLAGHVLLTTGPKHLPFTVEAVTNTEVSILPRTGKRRRIPRNRFARAMERDLHGDAWCVSAVVSQCLTTQNASYIAGILRVVT